MPVPWWAGAYSPQKDQFMEIEPIGVAIILAGLLVLARGPQLGSVMLTLSTLLGAAAAIQLPALGGAVVQPSALMLGFFVAASASSARVRRYLPSTVTYPGPGFWLLAVTVYGIITAVFLPRLFNGVISVYSIARVEPPVNLVQSLLAPSAGNFTQATYLVANLACFIAVCAFAMTGGAVTVARAVMLTAAANLALVAVDAWTSITGMQDVLSFIRNANYTLYETGDVNGVRRIIGSFTEAGAFAYATLGLFAFCAGLWLQGLWTRTAGLLAIMLLALLMLSTSSAAYGAVAIYAVCLYIVCFASIVAGQATSRQIGVVFGAPALIVPVVMVALFIPSAWDMFAGFFDTVLFSKFASQSGIERAIWNGAALQAFYDTLGLGGGLGSIRGSSFPAVVLANVGLIGALLYIAFFVSLVIAALRRSEESTTDHAIGRAATAAWLTLLIPACIDAVTPDLGLSFSIFSAVSAAPALRYRRKTVGPLARARLSYTG
jgi:hypothetical protein